MSTVVEIEGVPIASKTVVITRAGDYIEQWSFLDSDGIAQPLLEAKIVVEPNDEPDEEWNQANGRFTLVSDGAYLLFLDSAYTAAIAWSSGSYHVYIVEASGFIDPCVTGGLTFATDC